MKKRNKDAKRKAFYNEKRDCYLSVDGKYYCYRTWDETGKRSSIQKFEVGKDLSVDLTVFLDESDHDMDLNDRYADEWRNDVFDAKVTNYDANPYDGDGTNPWNTIADKGGSPEDVLFAEPVPENPQVALVRQVIEEKCTEPQQNFFHEHFGMKKQMEEIRQEEAVRTGKLPSQVAMTNRKNKILDKIAKILGVERVKRCKHNKD